MTTNFSPKRMNTLEQVLLNDFISNMELEPEVADASARMIIESLSNSTGFEAGHAIVDPQWIRVCDALKIARTSDALDAFLRGAE